MILNACAGFKTRTPCAVFLVKGQRQVTVGRGAEIGGIAFGAQEAAVDAVRPALAEQLYVGVRADGNFCLQPQ
jgi:hypothetical protein